MFVYKNNIITMKNSILVLFALVQFFLIGHSQDNRISQNNGRIRLLLTGWDQNRGAWLASSFIAMSNNQPIPDRTFPEMLTPAQMFTFVPEQTRTDVTALLDSNYRIEREIIRENRYDIAVNVFRMVTLIAQRPNTSVTSGDPHMVTFDGEYFQNTKVGEFTLAKSATTNFEIQARFENINEAASFTTAVSMNVGGDKVHLFANEKPDNYSFTSLRVNDKPITINNPIYYLPMGGSVSYMNGVYTVNWATGECAKIVVKNYADKRYFDITIQIHEDENSDYEGISTGLKGKTQEEHIGRSQVSPQTSLFLYGANQSFEKFNKQQIKPIKEPIMTQEMRANARTLCSEAGINGPMMEGCISDYAKYGILPSVLPAFEAPVINPQLVNLSEIILNTNETLGEMNTEKVSENNEKQKVNDITNPNGETILREFIRIAPYIIFNGGGGGVIIR